MLLNESAADLGSLDLKDFIDISRNLRGRWVKNVQGACKLSLVGGTFEEDKGVGIGLSGGTHGFILCKTKMFKSAYAKLPVKMGNILDGQQMVGDGLTALEHSGFQIDSVQLSGNARKSMLFGGPITNLKFDAGDEKKGKVVIQGITMDDAKPSVNPNVTLEIHEDSPFAIATAPAAP